MRKRLALKNDVPRARKAAGRKPSRKSSLTRRLILDAAAAEFAEKGYSLAKLANIADAVGIHLSALYYHFDTKEALATEVVAQVPRESAEAIRAALDATRHTSHRERIGTAVRVYLRRLLRQDDFVRAGLKIGQQAPAQVRQRSLEIVREESKMLKDLLKAARAAGMIRTDIDLTMARMILFGAMNWTVEWFRPGKVSVDQLADQLLTVILDGMSADRAVASRRSRT